MFDDSFLLFFDEEDEGEGGGHGEGDGEGSVRDHDR